MSVDVKCVTKKKQHFSHLLRLCKKFTITQFMLQLCNQETGWVLVMLLSLDLEPETVCM